MKKLFLLLTLSVTLIGCSKDDDGSPSQTFSLLGNWTEVEPTAGRHKITFMNATQLGVSDDSAEGIIYDHTYTLENDILTVTTSGGVSSTHEFEIVNANTIKVTGLNFYAQPVNALPVVVTYVKD